MTWGSEVSTERHWQDDSDKLVVDEIQNIPDGIHRPWVSNLIFVHLVSNHGKAGSQNPLKGKNLGGSYIVGPCVFVIAVVVIN